MNEEETLKNLISEMQSLDRNDPKSLGKILKLADKIKVAERDYHIAQNRQLAGSGSTYPIIEGVSAYEGAVPDEGILSGMLTDSVKIRNQARKWINANMDKLMPLLTSDTFKEMYGEYEGLPKDTQDNESDSSYGPTGIANPADYLRNKND